ncbi:MAG: hypothetical protein HYS22_04640 [Deltaproteobacteria bacterium]|nr:hypothetical protein [Deltaproteobacteria bacterium]
MNRLRSPFLLVCLGLFFLAGCKLGEDREERATENVPLPGSEHYQVLDASTQGGRAKADSSSYQAIFEISSLNSQTTSAGYATKPFLGLFSEK